MERTATTRDDPAAGTWRRALAGAVLVLFLDQATKLAVRQCISPDAPIVVVSGFLHLRHALNDGAAWSILRGARWLLSGISVAALAALFRWRHDVLSLGPRLGGWTFALLTGGITGNLIDRLATGKVVDFLDFQFGTYHYPTFNVADSAICVGVFLYVVATLLAGRRKEN